MAFTIISNSFKDGDYAAHAAGSASFVYLSKYARVRAGVRKNTARSGQSFGPIH